MTREPTPAERKGGIVPGLIPESALPPTRLELKWRELSPNQDGYSLYCDYELVLEIGQWDIRGEVYENDTLVRRERELRRSLGGTRADGSAEVSVEHGTIRTPFRDHSHIRQDALRLGIPAFVVANGWAMRILPAVPEPTE